VLTRVPDAQGYRAVRSSTAALKMEVFKSLFGSGAASGADGDGGDVTVDEPDAKRMKREDGVEGVVTWSQGGGGGGA